MPGEAINDFWSMSGNFIFRHHVESRVKLHSSREESFPFPLKYIDASRTTETNLDVKQEKRIDDHWNIDGSRDVSDSWTGLHYGLRNSRRINAWCRLKKRYQSSIIPEDCEVSLTLRTRSSRKSSRMLERNWKHQWLQPHLARHARKSNMRRPKQD